MLKSNDKIKDSQILSQEDRKCEKFKWQNNRFTNTITRKWNMRKIKWQNNDRRILSQESQICENQMAK